VIVAGEGWVPWKVPFVVVVIAAAKIFCMVIVVVMVKGMTRIPIRILDLG